MYVVNTCYTVTPNNLMYVITENDRCMSWAFICESSTYTMFIRFFPFDFQFQSNKCESRLNNLINIHLYEHNTIGNILGLVKRSFDYTLIEIAFQSSIAVILYNSHKVLCNIIENLKLSLLLLPLKIMIVLFLISTWFC